MAGWKFRPARVGLPPTCGHRHAAASVGRSRDRRSFAVTGRDVVAARVVRNFDDFPEELVRLRLPRARISQEGPRLIRQFFPFSLFPAAVWSAEPAECWQRYLARLSLFPASF